MPFDLPPPDPGIEFVIATRGMSKGLSQTDGPQFLGRGYAGVGDFQVGAQWKNVNSSSAGGEASLFINASRKIGTLQLSGGAAYKMLTGLHARVDKKCWEFTGAASRKFGPVTARINAIFSPDDLGSARRSLFVEAGPAVQLARGWTASAALGVRRRDNGADYTAFNAGVTKAVGPLQLDVRYYDTNHSGLGVPYHARVVGSARLRF